MKTPFQFARRAALAALMAAAAFAAAPSPADAQEPKRCWVEDRELYDMLTAELGSRAAASYEHAIGLKFDAMIIEDEAISAGDRYGVRRALELDALADERIDEIEALLLLDAADADEARREELIVLAAALRARADALDTGDFVACPERGAARDARRAEARELSRQIADDGEESGDDGYQPPRDADEPPENGFETPVNEV